MYRLLGGSLRSLRIEGAAYSEWLTNRPDDRDNPEALIAIYTHLDIRSPRLETLSVTVDKFHDDIVGPLMEAVCGLHNLLNCKLEGVFVTPRVLSHLASLPSLQTLHIETRNADFADGLGDVLSTVDNPFPELQRPCLFFEYMPLCTDLMRAIRSSKLDRVVVRTVEPVSEDELIAFGSALVDHPSAGTFSFLTVLLGMIFDNDAVIDPLPPSAFLPFASLHRIKMFIADGTSFAGLDDATLEAMARGWPEIRKAWMVPICRHVADITSRATYSVFKAFIEHCPHLVELGFALEDVTHEAIVVVFESITRPRRLLYLTMLGVGSSFLSAKDAPAVAALFSLWFPQRLTICSWTRVEETGVEQNEEVRERLRLGEGHWSRASSLVYVAFYAVREEEHRWYRNQKKHPTRTVNVASNPSPVL